MRSQRSQVRAPPGTPDFIFRLMHIGTPEKVIFPMPYTSDMELGGKVVLSSLTQMSVCATLVALEDNPSATVVIAGEHTFGKDLPSTGEIMEEKIVAAGVNPENVVLLDDEFGGRLDNTPLQVTAFNIWLQQFLGYNPEILTLAHGFHAPRLEVHMGRYGVLSTYRDISSLLMDADLADTFPELQLLDKFEARERWVRGLSYVDRKGLVTKVATNKLGPHVHNILVGENGELEVIDMSAKRRIAELELLGLSI